MPELRATRLTLRSFRDIVEADPRRAARRIIKIQEEINWHFRIATLVGDYHLSVMMPLCQGWIVRGNLVEMLLMRHPD